jgi:CheY-like chemotaxis protein
MYQVLAFFLSSLSGWKIPLAVFDPFYRGVTRFLMDLRGKRILCVEDHEDTCAFLRVLLSDLQVVTANTLAEGLDFAKNQCFDLYLLDMFLPDGDGITLCQQLRRLDAKTPVLFCSADASQTACDQALQAGAQIYLNKPVDPFLLREAIEDLLKGGHLAEPLPQPR